MSLTKTVKKTFQYGEHTISLETGLLARQADGAVLVSMGDTVLLVTVVGKKTDDGSKNFFPLTVNYQERYYASGSLPGGFIKRESRPSTNEILTSRLIDRPLRPLFPEDFRHEIQVVATLMSLDPEIPSDILAIIGAAAALEISGIPFNGPLAAARVGYMNGSYTLNPNRTELKTSTLDLVVAGSEDAILMVESEAKELSEELMLGAIMFGHTHMQTAISAIKEFAAEVGVTKWNWQPPVKDQAFIAQINQAAEADLAIACAITDKPTRNKKIADIQQAMQAKFNADPVDTAKTLTIKESLSNLENTLIRKQILASNIRVDGRDLHTVRPIDIHLAVLPRAHGSAIFTRGETQALAVVTLGTDNDAQIIDTPSAKSSERFMLHYNFPPYCTGEVGMMGTPKRREIGHGNLAKRALQAVVPDADNFPYVIRVVSEVTASNGSSSMATVCGTSLALMDAGVPITAPVAGVAMGLIKEGDAFAVLTDILGDEDHIGDMDFKVAGTANGITALQMDIKIAGITETIMDVALKQAKAGRIHIFNLMHEKIANSRAHVSDYAPRIITMKINPEKIRDVIGKGGAVIRGIIEETGATIDIKDDGSVTIASSSKEGGAAAVAIIESLTAEPEIGKVYVGQVIKIMDFGAFVNIMPNRDGLVHISQISHERVNQVGDFLHEGDTVKVKVMEVDRQGKIRLSMKEVTE